MTYEELIVHVVEISRSLPNSGVRLLWELIGAGIQNRTREITMSQRQLAEQLGMSRDNVALAARELKHHLQIDSSSTNTTTFLLPSDWLETQLGLFAVRERPGNQATVAWKNGQWWPGKQTSGGLETRPEWPGKPATVDEIPGQVDEKPGHSGLETRPRGLNTRPRTTQNQQLSDSSLSIESTEGMSSFVGVLLLEHSIGYANCIPDGRKEDAKEIREGLHGYINHIKPSGPMPKGPDNDIVARCLAIAPNKVLVETLHMMFRERLTPKPSWAWFVTVLCDRIHGKKPNEVPCPEGYRQGKKNASRESGEQFSSQLLEQVNGVAKRM